MTQYCYSTNEENYHGHFDTREEAAAEIDGEPGWTAVIEEYPTDSLASGHGQDVVERLSERLFDFCGEAAENFDPTKQEIDELDSLIAEQVKAWLEARGGVKCWGVADVQSHEASDE